jgi:hypothetical protein
VRLLSASLLCVVSEFVLFSFFFTSRVIPCCKKRKQQKLSERILQSLRGVIRYIVNGNRAVAVLSLAGIEPLRHSSQYTVLCHLFLTVYFNVYLDLLKTRPKIWRGIRKTFEGLVQFFSKFSKFF